MHCNKIIEITDKSFYKTDRNKYMKMARVCLPLAFSRQYAEMSHFHGALLDQWYNLFSISSEERMDSGPPSIML